MRIRFYHRGMPLQEWAWTNLVLVPGHYIRFQPDEPAWRVESMCIIYKDGGEAVRVDIEVSEQHPGGFPPFPPITRASSAFEPIPSLDPPKKDN